MANQDIPVVQRHEGVQQTNTPEFQSSFEANAESTNWMSAIGTQAAQSASNATAQMFGYNEGKNPHGDLTPGITDFDKTFENAYHTQANNVLSLQGQKLLEDSQLELSKATKLTPDLVERTNQQVQLGLSKIAQNAPTAIKGQLDATFASQALHQSTQFKDKMYQEQREDDKNKALDAADLYVKNAQELASSGDNKGAQASVVSAIDNADSLLATHQITPLEARTQKETAIQAGINGQYIYKATQAYKAGKYAEFAADYAKKKPEGMTNEQYAIAGNHFEQQINFLQGLKEQDENLKSQLMINRIASTPGDITDTQWQTFANSVSPIKAAQVRFKYNQALNKHKTDTSAVDNLIKAFSSPEAQAIAPDKVKNGAFLKSVDYMVSNSANTANPISHDDAEAIVANNAGGQIPVFTKGVSNKLHSSNPAFMDSGVAQIHKLEAMGGGHALAGLSNEDKVLASMYTSLKDKYAGDAITAARETTQNVLNQNSDQQKMVKQKLSNYLTTTAQKVPLDQFALSMVGLKKGSFMNPTVASNYGTDLLNVFSDLYQTSGGDQILSQNLLQKYVDQNYGETRVNGGRYTSLHPIEQTLGFEAHDAVPYIQQDLISQMNKKLEPIKTMYNTLRDPNVPGVYQTNEYYEMVPLSGKTHGIIRDTYDPVKIRHVVRGKTDEVFDIALNGNTVGNYDVSFVTGSGMKNIHLVAPYLQILNYTPDSKAIHANYDKDHHIGKPLTAGDTARNFILTGVQ